MVSKRPRVEVGPEIHPWSMGVCLKWFHVYLCLKIFLVFQLDGAPEGDDFLQLWQWYSKIRREIGALRQQAPGPMKRAGVPSMYKLLQGQNYF